MRTAADDVYIRINIRIFSKSAYQCYPGNSNEPGKKKFKQIVWHWGNAWHWITSHTKITIPITYKCMFS